MTARNSARRSGLGGRVFFGVLVIVIGVLFLVDKAGIAELDSLLDWWPSLIILYGAWRLIANRFRSLFLPLLLIFGGVVLQLRELDTADVFSTIWPAFLIALGVAIVIGGMRSRNRRQRGGSSSHSASTIIDVDLGAPADADDGTLHAVAGSQDRIVSGDFYDGSINVVMGNGTLDMRDATIVDKPATLEVSVVMGEVKVRVPTEWNVRIVNSSQMGDTKDTRRSQNNSDDPDLIIRGSVTMGSLQITD
jgi:predicted membrane protein